MPLEKRRRHVLQETTGAQQVAYAVLFAILTGVCLLVAAEASLEERLRLLRYWTLLASGFFAVAVPHLLLPDMHLAMIQRLNWSPARLRRHQLRRWGNIVGFFSLPSVALALFDVNRPAEALGVKAGYLAACLLFMAGIGLFSFTRYVNIGPVSQAWQEGTKGAAYRAIRDNSPYGFLVPDGMVPAMLVTTQVFALALAGLLGMAYLQVQAGMGWIGVPGLLVAGWAGVLLGRLGASYDRAFYATNAFYSEAFRSAGGVRLETREAVPYRSLYWVPRRWKPSVWASLRQLDRRLPLGRFVVAGLVLLGFLYWRDTSALAVNAYLVLFVLAKNSVIVLLVTSPFAPPMFQHMIQSPWAWVGTRLFVNVRWTPALLASLLVVAFLDADARMAYTHAILWACADVVIAFLTAAFATYVAEFHYPRRFA